MQIGSPPASALALAERLDTAAETDLSLAEDNRAAAQALARMEVSDAVVAAMADFDGSLRDFQRKTGIDAAVVSRLMNQHHKQGGTVATLAQIALGLGKSLKITIE